MEMKRKKTVDVDEEKEKGKGKDTAGIARVKMSLEDEEERKEDKGSSWFSSEIKTVTFKSLYISVLEGARAGCRSVPAPSLPSKVSQ